MRIASLGSGSRGNGTLVEDDETCLLVDLGFTLKETERRLKVLAKKATDIDAILVTHEHSDHIHGVGAFARKYKIPVYLSPGTYSGSSLNASPEIERINCHKAFGIKSIKVEPVPVPHDAKEPCQYLFSSEDYRFGVLTDLGHITSHVVDSYKACDALFLESNHDPAMLLNGPYPYPLKQRVGGDHGHLNNGQAAELLLQVDLGKLRHLVLSHISEHNNTPKLALDAVEPVLEKVSTRVHLAKQAQVLDWIDLSSP